LALPDQVTLAAEIAQCVEWMSVPSSTLASVFSKGCTFHLPRHLLMRVLAIGCRRTASQLDAESNGLLDSSGIP